MARRILYVVALLFWTPAAVRAALYEFTITGQITKVVSVPEVSVGDPFSIQYIVDSEDYDPASVHGGYFASRAAVTLPNLAFESSGPFNGVGVYLNILDGRNRVRYSSEDDSPYEFDVIFDFPHGTLSSDELPLTLPLQSAMSATFAVYGLGPALYGDVGSYRGVEVPEPIGVLILSFFSIFIRPHRNAVREAGHETRDTYHQQEVWANQLSPSKAIC